MKFTRDEDTIILEDSRKVGISISSKKGKVYRTYQMYMKTEYFELVFGEAFTKKKSKIFLNEINYQQYSAQELSDEMCLLGVNINPYTKTINKTTIPMVLPKNDLPYIKAYDNYLEFVSILGIKPVPLRATVLIKIKPNHNKFETEMNIYFRVKLDNNTIKILKEKNHGVIPTWLDILMLEVN